MKKLLLGLMLLLVSGAASAEWTDVGDNEEITLYVDRTTIRRNGNFVKMWSLADFKKAKGNNVKSFLSSRTQNEYDCAGEKMRRLALTTFSGQMLSGEATYTNSDTDKWVSVPPSSVMEAQWKIACGKK